MHVTAPDVNAATNFAAQFTAEIQLAQRDALQTIHKVMLYVAEGITGPKPAEDDREDPAQARTTTQRIRLCLQAARDILRLSSPQEAGALPPSPGSAGDRVFRSGANEDRKSPSDAQHHSTPSTEGRMRVPCAAQQRGVEPEVNQRGLQDRNRSLSTPAAQPASTLLAAAGAAVSRFGERITSPTHDSGLSTHDSPPPLTPGASRLAPESPPSSVSSVSSVVKTPPLVPPPPLTEEERSLLDYTQKGSKRFVPFQVLHALRAWQLYAEATGTKPPFDVPRESIFPSKRKRNGYRPRAQRDETDRGHSPPDNPPDPVDGS